MFLFNETQYSIYFNKVSSFLILCLSCLVSNLIPLFSIILQNICSVKLSYCNMQFRNLASLDLISYTNLSIRGQFFILVETRKALHMRELEWINQGVNHSTSLISLKIKLLGYCFEKILMRSVKNKRTFRFRT